MPSDRTSSRAGVCLAIALLAGPPSLAAAGRDVDAGGAGLATRIVRPLDARTVMPEPTRVVDAALSSGADVPAAPAAPDPVGLAFVPDPSGIADAAAGRSCRWPGADTLAAILPVAADNGSHASGVVFAPGRVLTAAHAVEGGSHFFVRVGNDFRLATLLLVDHAADLAVLAVETPGIEPLALADADPDDREPVWAAGYPRAQAMTTSVGVFQKRRDGALHTSAPIDSGQSGGGLLACTRGTYRLAGLLRGYGAYLSGNRYVKLENHSVSVSASTIHRFLDAYR